MADNALERGLLRLLVLVVLNALGLDGPSATRLDWSRSGMMILERGDSLPAPAAVSFDDEDDDDEVDAWADSVGGREDDCFVGVVVDDDTSRLWAALGGVWERSVIPAPLSGGGGGDGCLWILEGVGVMGDTRPGEAGTLCVRTSFTAGC